MRNVLAGRVKSNINMPGNVPPSRTMDGRGSQAGGEAASEDGNCFAKEPKMSVWIPAHHISSLEYTARRICESRGGKWTGPKGMACCPAHKDRIPSLGVTLGRKAILFHCFARSEEHTSELQFTNAHLVCRLLLEKK